MCPNAVPDNTWSTQLGSPPRKETTTHRAIISSVSSHGSSVASNCSLRFSRSAPPGLGGTLWLGTGAGGRRPASGHGRLTTAGDAKSGTLSRREDLEVACNLTQA
eukprot:3437875-Prymnesium_polylepis.1